MDRRWVPLLPACPAGTWPGCAHARRGAGWPALFACPACAALQARSAWRAVAGQPARLHACCPLLVCPCTRWQARLLPHTCSSVKASVIKCQAAPCCLQACRLPSLRHGWRSWLSSTRRSRSGSRAPRRQLRAQPPTAAPSRRRWHCLRLLWSRWMPSWSRCCCRRPPRCGGRRHRAPPASRCATEHEARLGFPRRRLDPSPHPLPDNYGPPCAAGSPPPRPHFTGKTRPANAPNPCCPGSLVCSLGCPPSG